MVEERENLERESESEVCGRGGVAMDTPERRQIATPVSKFEDSPVFNYINSLSPIQPVKSLHITQTFNSLSFASLPSVFTSPHVSSLKESRFLRRHQFSELSKPEFSSENGNKVDTKEGTTDVAYNSAERQEIFDPGSSVGEASDEPSYECSKLAIELSRTLSYDCVSPDCNPSISCGIETTCVSELAGTSTSLDPFVQEVSEKGSFGSEVHMEEISQIDENTEIAGCDWESLISDAADLITFDSPTDAEPLKGPSQKSHNTGLSFCASHIDDLPETQAAGAVCLSERYESENPSTQPGEAGDMGEIVEKPETFACISLENCMAGEPSEKMDDELASNLQRGTRRRCLVFEMVGARRKHFDDGPTCGSSMLSQSHGNIASNDQHLVSLKPVNDSSPRILPGIGLHLNALATTSMDNKVVKCEALASGGQLISVPRSSSSFHSLTIVQEPSNKFMAATSSERNMGPAENQVPDVEDASQASGYVVNEEFNQSSPKKKRRRLEHAGESEACKRCNCKKSKCLKLYCECFAAGVYCVEPCSCQECFNKPIHEDTVLATRKLIESRNPLAFAPKVIRSSDSALEIGDESNKTPASARHKRGCNCKKSGCLKKYCECYQGGVGCSINCRCDGCKNAFGRKDGSALIGTEAELEEEEIDECEKSVVDRALQKTAIQNDSEDNIDSAPPATPLQFGRSSIQLPFSSNRKPPRSSSLAIGSSSGLYSSHRIGKLNPVQPQAKFEKHFQTIREDEIPEMPPILEQNGSLVSGIKSSSPNSKRVSPPHCDIGSSSPGKRTSRKLILRSIPSFPSLTPKH